VHGEGKYVREGGDRLSQYAGKVGGGGVKVRVGDERKWVWGMG
jgi:hypothetical protein